MTKIKGGKFYEGLTKGVNSVTDSNYYCANAEMDSDGYDIGFKYLSISGSENYAWRDCYDESDYGIDPYDYETEEEFMEAVEEIY